MKLPLAASILPEEEKNILSHLEKEIIVLFGMENMTMEGNCHLEFTFTHLK